MPMKFATCFFTFLFFTKITCPDSDRDEFAEYVDYITSQDENPGFGGVNQEMHTDPSVLSEQLHHHTYQQPRLEDQRSKDIVGISSSTNSLDNSNFKSYDMQHSNYQGYTDGLQMPIQNTFPRDSRDLSSPTAHLNDFNKKLPQMHFSNYVQYDFNQFPTDIHHQPSSSKYTSSQNQYQNFYPYGPLHIDTTPTEKNFQDTYGRQSYTSHQQHLPSAATRHHMNQDFSKSNQKYYLPDYSTTADSSQIPQLHNNYGTTGNINSHESIYDQGPQVNYHGNIDSSLYNDQAQDSSYSDQPYTHDFYQSNNDRNFPFPQNIQTSQPSDLMHTQTNQESTLFHGPDDIYNQPKYSPISDDNLPFDVLSTDRSNEIYDSQAQIIEETDTSQSFPLPEYTMPSQNYEGNTNTFTNYPHESKNMLPENSRTWMKHMDIRNQDTTQNTYNTQSFHGDISSDNTINSYYSDINKSPIAVPLHPAHTEACTSRRRSDCRFSPYKSHFTGTVSTSPLPSYQPYLNSPPPFSLDNYVDDISHDSIATSSQRDIIPNFKDINQQNENTVEMPERDLNQHSLQQKPESFLELLKWAEPDDTLLDSVSTVSVENKTQITESTTKKARKVRKDKGIPRLPCTLDAEKEDENFNLFKINKYNLMKHVARMMKNNLINKNNDPNINLLADAIEIMILQNKKPLDESYCKKYFDNAKTCENYAKFFKSIGSSERRTIRNNLSLKDIKTGN